MAKFENLPDTICSGTAIQLVNTSVNAIKYYWFFDSIVSEQVNPTFTFTTKGKHTIKLLAYDLNGKVSEYTESLVVLKVDFRISPEVQMEPTYSINIENLSSPSFVIWYWNFGDGSKIVSSKYDEYFTHSYSAYGEYNVTLIASGAYCADSITKHATIIPSPPITSFSGSVEECVPFTAEFYANTQYADSFRWHIYKEGDINEMAVLTERNPFYPFNTAGTYIARLYAAGPGTTPAGSYMYLRTDTIFIYPVPEINATIRPAIVETKKQYIICTNTSTNANRWEWNFGDGTPLSEEKSPRHLYENPGLFEVTLTAWSGKNCVQQIIVDTVEAIDRGYLLFPTAFTPDISGPSGGFVTPGKEYSNDIFLPVGSNIDSYLLKIIDQVGRVVFTSDQFNKGWDGYTNGRLNDMGEYYYQVTYTTTAGLKHQLVGSFLLIK